MNGTIPAYNGTFCELLQRLDKTPNPSNRFADTESSCLASGNVDEACVNWMIEWFILALGVVTILLEVSLVDWLRLVLLKINLIFLLQLFEIHNKHSLQRTAKTL